MDAMHPVDTQTHASATGGEGAGRGLSIWQRLANIMHRIEAVGRPRSGERRTGSDAEEPVRFVGFDEQRNYGDEGRADIVFGPDMFDPRTENGDRPLSRAVAEGHSDIDPADFEKTVGEVLGGEVDLDELARVSLRNADSIEIQQTDIA